MSYHDDRSAWFTGQGLWAHVPETDWQDWTWQLKNRITTVAQLERYMTLTPEEIAFYWDHAPDPFPAIYELKDCYWIRSPLSGHGVAG